MVELPATAMVEDLKEALSRRMDAPASTQRLIYGGRELVDGRMLLDYEIDDIVHLVLRLRGGMFHISTDAAARSRSLDSIGMRVVVDGLVNVHAGPDGPEQRWGQGHHVAVFSCGDSTFMFIITRCQATRLARFAVL